MRDDFSRRELLGAGISAMAVASSREAFASPVPADDIRPILTPADKFFDVSRGNPVPHSLKADALINARLTPETWRLEIFAEGGANLAKPLTLANGMALDLSALLQLGSQHSIKFLKAVQCLNIPRPLGQGLWEGILLRDLLKLAGPSSNVRRVYYQGFHNNDPKQVFRSSLSMTQVMETPPWELPAFVAFRLNGQPIPLARGGPVRMLIPWAHGFKSIKWLNQIILTNDFRANDTYADANNDPESHLKTAAYLDGMPEKFDAGAPVILRGSVIHGLSGLKHVEAAVRKVENNWDDNGWKTCRIDPAPSDWSSHLPAGINSREIWGFNRNTGKPKEWPMRYGMAGWTSNAGKLAKGVYEVRARAVDLNGFAQPEPRADRQTGLNGVEVKRFEVG